MNEKTESLILEHLRAMGADIATLRDDVSGIKVEMASMRQITTGVVTLQSQDHGDIATLRARVDRIERRLDLVE